MEKFSGLRDYRESSITVEELTDSWFRIENYTRVFYRWIFWIIFEMNKIFEQWTMKWSVDKCFWRLLAGEKKTILIFIRKIKLFENNWERKRSIRTHEKTIHQEYRITYFDSYVQDGTTVHTNERDITIINVR